MIPDPNEAFVIEGCLVLEWQPGCDGWTISRGWLDDMVAEHFAAERELPSGNRFIGPVRITIEKLEKKEEKWR